MLWVYGYFKYFYLLINIYTRRILKDKDGPALKVLKR